MMLSTHTLQCVSYLDSIALWRALPEEERLLRRWREIPRQVAASMAFEGEPVDFLWLSQLHPQVPPPAGSKPVEESSATLS